MITVLKVTANPVAKYIERPEHQLQMADINKLWDLGNIRFLPQEIKPKDRNVVPIHDNGIPSLWKLDKITSLYTRRDKK